MSRSLLPTKNRATIVGGKDAEAMIAKSGPEVTKATKQTQIVMKS